MVFFLPLSYFPMRTILSCFGFLWHYKALIIVQMLTSLMACLIFWGTILMPKMEKWLSNYTQYHGSVKNTVRSAISEIKELVSFLSIWFEWLISKRVFSNSNAFPTEFKMYSTAHSGKVWRVAILKKSLKFTLCLT